MMEVGGWTTSPPHTHMAWSETDEHKKRQRVAASDEVMVERHREFDLSAQDRHAKHERASFSVVGEGTRTANERYRRGYSRINWDE